MKFYKEWLSDWEDTNLMIRVSIKNADGTLEGPFHSRRDRWPTDAKAIDCMDEKEEGSGIYGFPFLVKNVHTDIRRNLSSINSMKYRAMEKEGQSAVIVLIDFDISSAEFDTQRGEGLGFENEMRAQRCNIISTHKVSDFMNEYYETFTKYLIWKKEEREKEYQSADSKVEEIAPPAIDGKLVDFIREMNWRAGVHGFGHSRRVYKYGTVLSQKNAKIYKRSVDLDVVRWFAYLHDIQRVFVGDDAGHGERAALFIDHIRKSYLKMLSDEQVHKLKEACRLHATILRTGDLTIDTCFDANRLDLREMGIIPNPKKMATEAGATMARLNEAIIE